MMPITDSADSGSGFSRIAQLIGSFPITAVPPFDLQSNRP